MSSRPACSAWVSLLYITLYSPRTYHDIDLYDELREGEEGCHEELDKEQTVEGGPLRVPRTHEQGERKLLVSIDLVDLDRVARL